MLGKATKVHTVMVLVEITAYLQLKIDAMF